MKTLLGTIFIGAVIVEIGGGQPSSADHNRQTFDEVHWTFTGPTSVSFDWRGTASTMQYGPTSSYGMVGQAHAPTPLPFSSSGPFQEVQIDKLEPNTEYHYSIGSGADHTFRTPPVAGSSGFRVDVEGDVGGSTDFPLVRDVQHLIGADHPDFALVLGDLTYGNGVGLQAVDAHFNDVMAWSQDAAYMPAWGNHEWDTPSKDDLRNYKGRFELPNPRTSPVAPVPGCCGKDWFWFDYGNVRFIAYPEPYADSVWDDWNDQAHELMNDAQADPHITFIVTFGHRPAFSSGYHPGNLQLRNYLNALGSAYPKYVLNLNGHSHNYERSYPQHGVIHVTAGTGGSELEQRNDTHCHLYRVCPPPRWSAFRAMHFGVLRLQFAPERITGSFVCGPAGGGVNDVHCSEGKVIDRFDISPRHIINAHSRGGIKPAIRRAPEQGHLRSSSFGDTHDHDRRPPRLSVERFELESQPDPECRRNTST